ncbi:MlaD family protein [Pseudomonas resinovorans]|uniref:MlaD family protein n=1 Tax=Metapseudomonas resinovorans TaxID=53412 RepID=A0ABT4YCY0_METRE|nr:MlaD family protein [Pseudomonas resinovorans]MDA8486370.1 MlaD family protein [Pseudomonas resinovorans]
MVQDTNKQLRAGHGEVRTRRWNVSLVWIVPIVALLVGASLIVRSWMQEGPEISISFRTGEGLVAHKTQVKYRSVVIGEVSSVDLAADRKSVIAKVRLAKEAESFAKRGAQFWVVRPRIGAGGVSGVDTLLSGNFIGADSGDSNVSEKRFIGLESPPPITYGEKGKRFMLTADDLGSLDIGSSIYYRRIPVGQVVSYALKPDGKGVNIGVFVNAPYDAFVTLDTRFWNASGVDVVVDANGLKVNTESLSSVLVGGLAFGTREHAAEAKPAADLQTFELFADRDSALAPPTGKPLYMRLRFDQTMRGLSVGAPVEFMGVVFGKVTSVTLDFDEAKQSFPAMVDLVVYPQRLGPVHQKMLQIFHHSPEDEAGTRRLIAAFVERGLRAQARSGNLITGQMYISFDLHPDAKPVVFDSEAQPLSIPTIPSSLEKVQEQLERVVDRISKLPLDSIANNLDGNLRELQGSLKQFNTQTLPSVKGTLDEVRQTLQAANSALAADSPQREKLSDTLDELDRTSRSLRDLSDYLGRHPESLIRGRPKSVNANSLQP